MCIACGEEGLLGFNLRMGGILSRLLMELYVGDQGVEYPKRFFARDFAGNRLEFSL